MNEPYVVVCVGIIAMSVWAWRLTKGYNLTRIIMFVFTAAITYYYGVSQLYP